MGYVSVTSKEGNPGLKVCHVLELTLLAASALQAGLSTKQAYYNVRLGALTIDGPCWIEISDFTSRGE